MKTTSRPSSSGSPNLADILERVLDKGVVIAGDVSVSIAEIELISIKVRLVICSVDKAIEMGINWWQKDPYLSSATEIQQLQSQNNELIKRLEALEKKNAKSK